MIRQQRTVLLARHSPRTTGYTAAVALVSLILCSLSLLAPIERGFPTLKVAGMPFRWPFIFTVALVVVFLAVDGRRIVRLLFTKYCARHALVLAILLAGAARSELPITAVARALAYMTAFVLNFIVLSWIFERGGRRLFVLVLCWVAVTAAALGVAEGLFSYRPPVFVDWFSNYQYELGTEAIGVGEGYRVNGTLGNAIVYAMAMILCIPFAAEIRSKWARIGVILLLVVAAAYTISKVVALAVLPVCIWALWRLKARRFILWGGFLTLLALGSQLAPGAGQRVLETLLFSRWSARLSDPRTAAYSLGVRAEMAGSVFSGATDPGSFLIGHGLLSESRVSREFIPELGTLDNTYLTFYYETGLVGLLAYLYAFVGPLWDLRHLAKRSLHYWAVVSLLMGSVSFVSYHYYTFNFVAAASIATLYAEQQVRRRQGPAVATAKSSPVRVGPDRIQGRGDRRYTTL